MQRLTCTLGQAHPRQVTWAGSVVTRSLAGISATVRPQHGISGLSGDGPYQIAYQWGSTIKAFFQPGNC
jgi:hypothetical protein